MKYQNIPTENKTK